MNKTVKIIFTVSLLLNLILLGVTGGMAAQDWRRHGMWTEAPRGFTPEGQKLVDAAFADFRAEGARSMEGFRQARSALNAVMQTEPFDEKAYDRQIQAMRRMREEMMERRTALMKDLAMRLPAEDRKKLGAQLMQRWRGWNKGGRRCASGG